MKIYTVEIADNAMAPARLSNVFTDYTKAIDAAKNFASVGPEKLLQSVYNPGAKTTVYINVKTNAYGRIMEWEI